MNNVSPNQGWAILTSSGGIVFYLISTVSGPVNYLGVNTTGSSPAMSFNNNQWYHLRLTYDGSRTAAGVQLFIDGVRQVLGTESNTLSNAIAVPAGIISSIGSRNGALVFSGGIANVDITIGSNRWLYPCSEGAGTTIYNALANAAHGTLSTSVGVWVNFMNNVIHALQYGFRDSAGTKIPALLSGASAADGNAITNPPGGHNGAETEFNWSADSAADPFVRHVGGTVPTAHNRAEALPANFSSLLTATNETSFRAVRA